MTDLWNGKCSSVRGYFASSEEVTTALNKVQFYGRNEAIKVITVYARGSSYPKSVRLRSYLAH